MKSDVCLALFTGFLTFVLLLSTVVTFAVETEFQVESTALQLYRDGLVRVTQTLVVNETVPAATLPLLVSSVENLVVLDENQSVLDYKIETINLTIYTLGATSVSFQYDTGSLTKKDFDVWTLIVDTPYNLTVLLPEESTVVYLSEIPTSIDTERNRITLSLYPSQWEISYILPLNSPTEHTDNGQHSSTIPLECIMAIILFAVFLLLVLTFVRRRGPDVEKIFKTHPQLKQEEKDVIRFLTEKDGKAFEAEIRERFPDLPRTSLWRLVRRLEKLELVRIKKIGLVNQVELKK